MKLVFKNSYSFWWKAFTKTLKKSHHAKKLQHFFARYAPLH